MFASIRFECHSVPSHHLAADGFEQASLGILRRYQQAASQRYIKQNLEPATSSDASRVTGRQFTSDLR